MTSFIICPQDQSLDIMTEEEKNFEELISDSILCSLQLARKVEMTYLTVIYNNLPIYIEIQHDPSLFSTPFALCDANSENSLIYQTLNEAKHLSNMKLDEALINIPNLILIPPNFSLYSDFLLQFFEIFSEYDSEFIPNGVVSATLNITKFMSESKLDVQTISQEIHSKITSIVQVPLKFNFASTKLLSNIIIDSDESESFELYEIESIKDQIRIDQIDGIPINKQQKLIQYGVETVHDLLLNRAMVSFLFPDKKFCWYLFSFVVNVDWLSLTTIETCQKSIAISDKRALEELKHELFILSNKISSKLKRHLSVIKFIKLTLNKGIKKFTRQMEIPFFTMNFDDIFYFSYSLLSEIIAETKNDIEYHYDIMKIHVSRQKMQCTVRQQSLSSWLVQTDSLEKPMSARSSSISETPKKKEKLSIYNFFEVSYGEMPRSNSVPQSKMKPKQAQKMKPKKNTKSNSKIGDLKTFFSKS